MLQYREVGSSEYTVAESGIPWVDPGSYTTMTVTYLSENAEYEFSVITKNPFNGGSSSNAVTVISETYGITVIIMFFTISRLSCIVDWLSKRFYMTLYFLATPEVSITGIYLTDEFVNITWELIQGHIESVSLGWMEYVESIGRKKRSVVDIILESGIPPGQPTIYVTHQFNTSVDNQFTIFAYEGEGNWPLQEKVYLTKDLFWRIQHHHHHQVSINFNF